MSKKKKKYYVVWKGRKPGIYQDWKECEEQIKGYEGAEYKSFLTRESAEKAFGGSYEKVKGVDARVLAFTGEQKIFIGEPVLESIAVDAAYSSGTGMMEYQGVNTKDKSLIFHKGPFPDGTINVGEFLALVHGIALLKKKGSKIPVYSDSRIAISWVKQKKANTKMPKTDKNVVLFDLIRRAEEWLQNNTYENPILKWETKYWGEIPADFNRK